ncbi:MAG: putative rane protein [Solirubrobacteraceae bacterium]|jgi:putative membrane protein|nr:putative rane protein [Solirubrobacteraceae bacterium]
MPFRLARAALPAAALALALGPAASAPAASPTARTQECGSGRHRTSAQDATWLMTGIQGDRFEIIGGTAAESKGATAAMKAFGARLVKDHSKSLRDAERAARRFGVDVPKTPSPSEQWELRTVGSFAGAAFDRSYADLEVQDHIQDIQETTDEVSEGCNVTVRGLARDDLPVLRQHLKIARQLLASGA